MFTLQIQNPEIETIFLKVLQKNSRRFSVSQK